MAWTPILDGAARDRAIATIREITDAIAGTHPPNLLGTAGHALLFAYVEQAEIAECPAHAALHDAVSRASELGAVGLWGGLADVGFLIAHLVDEHAPPLDAIESAILAAPWPERDDLIGGVVGLGVLAAEHLQRVPDAPLARAIADRVLARLEQPRGDELNFGLAHGIPSIVALAARFVEQGIEPARSGAVRDAVGELLAAVPQRDDGRFTNTNAPDQPLSRLAWCYGDPGVALALRAAGHDIGALVEGMLRRPVDRSGVVDTGICHGAAGLAHIFNRLYHATGNTRLRDAARTWIDRIFELRRPDEPIAGFPMFRPDDNAHSWRADAGILNGAPGVALVLLAAATELEPAWDRALLI